jgi:transposase, IS5 family
VAGGPGRSYARRRSSRGSPVAASGSPSRSRCACAAKRSPTGSCRSPIPTPGQSAKGKLGKPNEFGYLAQICEVTENTRSGARGLLLPAATASGSPGENTLLPDTVQELERLGLRPREVALDGGFGHLKSEQQLAPIGPDRVFLAGRKESGSKRTRRRLRRYRTGAEGRISHPKRRYGLRRSRLKGAAGQRTWTGWAILAYDLDTLAIRPA